MSFRAFLESEEKKNVDSLLASVPASHRKLLDGYKFTYTPNNTLKGDSQHIGYIFKNKIVVAAPWNYSRAFTTLHEIAHLVWEYIMTKDLRKQWSELLKKTQKKQIEKFKKEAQRRAIAQSPEEVFCMAYAAHYSNHPPVIWHNEEWKSFMEKIKNLSAQ
jgi:hypothetical protein